MLKVSFFLLGYIFGTGKIRYSQLLALLFPRFDYSNVVRNFIASAFFLLCETVSIREPSKATVVGAMLPFFYNRQTLGLDTGERKKFISLWRIILIIIGGARVENNKRRNLFLPVRFTMLSKRIIYLWRQFSTISSSFLLPRSELGHHLHHRTVVNCN